MDIRKSEVFNNHPDVAPALRWQRRYKQMTAMLFALIAIMATVVIMSSEAFTTEVMEFARGLILVLFAFFFRWRKDSREEMQGLWKKFTALAHHLGIRVETLGGLTLLQAGSHAQEKLAEKAGRIVRWQRDTLNVKVTNTTPPVITRVLIDLRREGKARDEELSAMIKLVMEFGLLPDAVEAHNRAFAKAETLMDQKGKAGEDPDILTIFQ